MSKPKSWGQKADTKRTPLAMREGYQAVEDALQSLAEQAQDLRMGYEVPEDKPARIWIGSGDSRT